MGTIDGSEGGAGDPRHFCTLRKNRINLNGTANSGMTDDGGDDDDNDGQGSLSPQSEASRLGQFCTIRGPLKKTAMGNAIGADREASGAGGAFYFADSEDDRSELNRNLLYEENMCTFENFCEKSLEHQQGEEGDPEEDESVGNFCTLRKKRSASQKAVDQVNGCDPQGSGVSDVRETSLGDREVGNPIGSYCTLKKKKLKLNQKFVESFLEDPNAKLHDYLSELDAYLDEIDGLDFEGQLDDGEVAAGEVAKQEIVKESDGDESSSISYIDVKNFCTLPKRKRVQFLNAFQRAGPLRRTFGAPSSSSSRSSNKATENGGTLVKREVIAEGDESSSTLAGVAAIDRDSVGAENAAFDQLMEFKIFLPDDVPDKVHDLVIYLHPIQPTSPYSRYSPNKESSSSAPPLDRRVKFEELFPFRQGTTSR